MNSPDDATLKMLLDRLMVRVYGRDSARMRALGYMFLGTREAMRLGDSRAASIYVRLLVRLKETGILTEAEARRFEMEHRQKKETTLMTRGGRNRPWQEWDTLILTVPGHRSEDR